MTPDDVEAAVERKTLAAESKRKKQTHRLRQEFASFHDP
jgi:hypothetical protein